MSHFTSNPFSSLLVTPSELHSAILNASSFSRRIVSVAAGRESGLESYADKHISGSVFFNLDECRDTTSPYPLMLPRPFHFAAYMTQLGIGADDILVFYDTLDTGLYFSPRAAWVCRYFGHQDVHVLNSFPSYVNQGYEVAEGQPAALAPEEDYPKNGLPEPNNVIGFEQLCDLLGADNNQQQFQILDARPETQFSGTDNNSSYVSGHMPSAVNIPFTSVLGPDKTILPAPQLQKLFQEKGVKENVPAILSCNSGVTAVGVELALHIAGYHMKKTIYDGSWMEWKERADKDRFIVTN